MVILRGIEPRFPAKELVNYGLNHWIYYTQTG